MMNNGRIRLLSAFALGVAAHSASAQPAACTEFIAEPMTAAELSEYAAILRLSAAQRAEIDSRVSYYRAQYRSLLQHDVTHLVEQTRREREAGPDSFFAPAAIERRLRSISSVQDRLAAIERAFVEQWATVLADDQLSRLQIVMDLRARTRLVNRIQAQGPIRFRSGPPDAGFGLDFRRLLRNSELTREEREAVEPRLRAYEIELLDRLRAYHDWVDRLRYADRYDSELPETIEAACAILSLHRTTMEAIVPIVGGGRAAALRNEVLFRLYPGVLPDPDRVSRLLEMSIASASTVEQRERLDGMRRAYEVEHDAISDALVSLLDEAMCTVEFWEPASASQPPRISRRLFEKLDARSRLNAQTLERAQNIAGIRLDTGDQLLPSPYRVAYDSWLVRPLTSYTIRFGGWESALWTEGAPLDVLFGARQIALLPPERLAAWCLVARLSDSQRQEVDGLVTALNEGAAEKQARLAEVSRTYRGAWTVDEEGRASPPSGEHTTRFCNGLRDVWRSTEELDEEFLLGFERMLEDTQLHVLPIIRAAYERWRRSSVTMSIGLVDVDNVHRADVVDLLDAVAQLSPGHIDTDGFWSALAEYEAEAASITRGMDDASEKATRLGLQLLASESVFEFDGGTNLVDLSTSESRPLVDACIAYRNHATRLAELNDRSMEKLRAVLAEEEYRVLREEYRRIQVPHVYVDGTAVHTVLASARELESLTTSQRYLLTELQLSYNDRYRNVTEQLWDAAYRGRNRESMALAADGTVARRAGYAEALAAAASSVRLQREREELNATIKRRLHDMLTPTQRRILGMEDQ